MFEIHPLIILKDFLRGLRLKFILFKSAISFYVFVRNCASQCTRLLKLREISVKRLKKLCYSRNWTLTQFVLSNLPRASITQ